MTVRKRHISTRPGDEPIHTSPTGMDFEKRQLVVTQISGVAVLSMISKISNALVVYDSVVVSYDGDVVYKL